MARTKKVKKEESVDDILNIKMMIYFFVNVQKCFLINIQNSFMKLVKNTNLLTKE